MRFRNSSSVDYVKSVGEKPTNRIKETVIDAAEERERNFHLVFSSCTRAPSWQMERRSTRLRTCFLFLSFPRFAFLSFSNLFPPAVDFLRSTVLSLFLHSTNLQTVRNDCARYMQTLSSFLLLADFHLVVDRGRFRDICLNAGFAITLTYRVAIVSQKSKDIVTIPHFDVFCIGRLLYSIKFAKCWRLMLNVTLPLSTC